MSKPQTREWYTSGELLSAASSAYDAGVKVGHAAERKSMEAEATRQCCEEMAEQCDVLLAALRQCDNAFVSWQIGQIPGRPEDILALIATVRAAIARAEGR